MKTIFIEREINWMGMPVETIFVFYFKVFIPLFSNYNTYHIILLDFYTGPHPAHENQGELSNGLSRQN